tara:strand:+ start:4516 stop:4782 length:267 start_codon:yes stop_codon:yes gene_type:complete
MYRTNYQQILLAATDVVEFISTSSRAPRWVGTLDDFVNYDLSQTLTITMLSDLINAINNQEIALPITQIDSKTVVVNTEVLDILGDIL